MTIFPGVPCPGRRDADMPYTTEPGFDQHFTSVVQGQPYSDLRVFNLASGKGVVIGTAGRPAQLSNDSVRRLRDLLSEYLGEAPDSPGEVSR